MNKNRIRLTVSHLHNIINESVRQMLSELDWKTSANAGKKAGKGGDISTLKKVGFFTESNFFFLHRSDASDHLIVGFRFISLYVSFRL